MRFFALMFCALTACNVTEKGVATPSLHPFVGCWQSEDGLAREGWTIDPSGWLFGYALNRDANGAVKFFEQMRIEYRGEASASTQEERATPMKDSEVLVVIGPNDHPVEFTREFTGAANEYQYTNPAHDYPQVITYTVSPGRLDAVISKLGGDDPVAFKKRACDGP